SGRVREQARSRRRTAANRPLRSSAVVPCTHSLLAAKQEGTVLRWALASPSNPPVAARMAAGPGATFGRDLRPRLRSVTHLSAVTAHSLTGRRLCAGRVRFALPDPAA